jgi:hypothetical protein
MDQDDIRERECWFDPGYDRTRWACVPVPRAWDRFDRALWGYETVDRRAKQALRSLAGKYGGQVDEALDQDSPLG